MLSYLEHLDHQVFFTVNHSLSSPLLDYFLWWVSLLGDGIPLTLLVGIVLWCIDRQVLKQHYVWLVVAVVAGSLVVQGLKYGLARPRPLTEFADLLQAGTVYINVVGYPLRYRSFPSGHMQAAASVFTYLLCLYPRYWYWWAAGPALIGLSRIYLGVHFPLDVLAGALLGGLSATGAWRWQGSCRARALGKGPSHYADMAVPR
jgi:undecaprenyl-diphosphatase